MLQNETVGYSAVDSIIAGPSYTVASGASAVLQAGKKIRLVPGFTAVQGSYFNTKIDPFLTQDATVVTYSYDARWGDSFLSAHQVMPTFMQLIHILPTAGFTPKHLPTAQKRASSSTTLPAGY